ncbi:PIN domain-containing protein [Amycolatopsis antarctica]|uniref:PIN domain-containing protein n=1 Tax=Amycolatopsis antarctica TaxID=1854586 RepID=A0A263CYX2_9PSEU|nr:PIN domain-containing protein [Amycolatopsis antarctica]OZM71362.1 PIN domain-containing protein [Amycolatopsis antarctica]
MAFPVLLDACVLVPISLADLLLRLAEAGTYRPLWSAEVLDEVERNLPKLRVDAARARHRVSVMAAVFPDAEVTGHEDLIGTMTNDPKDRHVLAAAVRGDAAIIVTTNLRDFPAAALSPYDIDAVSPDGFLLDQLDLYPDTTLRCMGDLVAAKQNPAETVEDWLARFERTAPRFVHEVRQLRHGHDFPVPEQKSG